MCSTLYDKITLSFDRFHSKQILLNAESCQWLILFNENQFTFANCRTNIVKLQNEFYKPRDLSENNELENLFDAILNQRSMAMDSGYVADVRSFLSLFYKTNPLSWIVNYVYVCRWWNITIALKMLHKRISAPMYLPWTFCAAAIMVWHRMPNIWNYALTIRSPIGRTCGPMWMNR